MLKTIARFLFWTVLVLALCFGIYFACRLAHIGREMAFVCAGAPVAFALCLVFCFRAVLARRRRRQIQQIVTIARDALPDASTEKRLLDNRWDRAVAILRSSNLGRRGNPVYALPWFMVMGKTGAGKSSAIGHCGLNAMLTDVGPEREHASTRNCDWYFFQEAVVLDTAGRYAVPHDETTDSAEWREFLQHLAKYRLREPLNGLVVAVAADTLYGGGEHLLAEARCLRRRIDEIMRILGANFPIYLMVTKIDLPAGTARVLEELPADARRQCMGRLIQSPDKKNLVPVGVQIRQALDDIQDKFRSLCLYRRDDSPQPHRIFAWEEFRTMMPALAAYAEEIFAENPYQETPLLRGIFFSSALRNDDERPGRAFPALSELMRGIFRTRENAAGFFLGDFFSRVLPVDRNLNRPIAEYLRWRSSVRLSAYAALLIATFGLAALVSLSYRHNATILRHMENPAYRPLWDATVSSRLLAFERSFRDTEQLEKRINSGFFPDMGLRQSRMGLAYFARLLNDEFVKDIYKPAQRRGDELRNRLTDKSSDKDFFILAADLVWRFDLVSAVLEGKKFEDLLKIPAMPQGMLNALNVGDIPMLELPAAYSMARYYYNEKDRVADMEQTLRSLRADLARMQETGGSMHWLAYRASVMNNIPPLKGGAFWPGPMSGALDDVQLAPAFTVEGFNVTLDYLDRLSLIVADDAYKSRTKDFLRWYAGSYAEAWKKFAAAFSARILGLAAVPMAKDAMSSMSGENNPFFALALRMDTELRPVRRYLDPLPPWLDDLDVFVRALTMETRANADHAQIGLAERLRENVRQLYEDAGNRLEPGDRERAARAEPLVKEIQAYLAALRDLVRFTLARDLAFNAVQEALPDEKNKNAATAKLALAKLAALSLRYHINPAQADDSPLLMLDNGPLSFFTTRLMNDAACHIQALWEGDVLSRVGTMSPIQLQQGLFAEQGGLARDFADNTLQYFLNRTLRGYEPQKLDGVPVPFTEDFLHFLNAGLLEYRPLPQSYAVTVDAVPVDVNDDALEKPYAVVLSLSCSKEKQELTNYNSPASMRFSWQREGCGDTNIAIKFKSATLNASYEGENAFAAFLHDFQYGEKTFHAQDFPAHQALLNKLGVRDITLRYRFTGADAIVRGVSYAPGMLPFAAAQCRR
ncbi:MAG: hypothetical protein LBR31_04610 [Desulfovibrio sp.]|jgi:type VI secretion system protein ImpL|nr:hypothetical protein [Desulfovibrio sp.]